MHNSKMDPYDYYHGQPRIDQYVELLLHDGYTDQYYTIIIDRFHKLGTWV